jgi:hypothetical protein
VALNVDSAGWEFLDPEVPHTHHFQHLVHVIPPTGVVTFCLEPSSSRSHGASPCIDPADEVGLSRATTRAKTKSGSGVVEVGKAAGLLASFVRMSSSVWRRSLRSLGQSGVRRRVDDRGGEPWRKGLLSARGPRAARGGIWADPVRRNPGYAWRFARPSRSHRVSGS